MSHSSRRTFYDSVIFLSHLLSQKRLPGLTAEETVEFDLLDATPPFDDEGDLAWEFEGQPTNDRERRWLELYSKMTSTPPLRSRYGPVSERDLEVSEFGLRELGKGHRIPDPHGLNCKNNEDAIAKAHQTANALAVEVGDTPRCLVVVDDEGKRPL